MQKHSWPIALVGALICAALTQQLVAKPLIIAHRGASAYLPEHTLAAKALAYGMGADYIEQDVVLTKDGHPIIMHDIHLDTVTNVAKMFPKRARKDGRYFAIDFTLAEIKTLNVLERFKRETGKAVYEGRFPLNKSHFQVPTLVEEIELVQGLNKSMGKNVGIYVEIKDPAWHRKEGQDVTVIVHKMLKQYGYPAKDKKVFLQCFDDGPLKRLKNEIKTDIPLIQLIAENSWGDGPADFDKMKTQAGIKQIATYAVGIGPWIGQLYTGKSGGEYQLTELSKWAKANRLTIHPFTARADQLPKGIADINELFDLLFAKIKVDGVFTDFPDLAAAYIDRTTN